MDCPCEDGIPGSDFEAEPGRSWLNIRLRINERIEFTTDPIAAHKTSASCLQRTTTQKSIATSHLLCTKNRCYELLQAVAIEQATSREFYLILIWNWNERATLQNAAVLNILQAVEIELARSWEFYLILTWNWNEKSNIAECGTTKHFVTQFYSQLDDETYAKYWFQENYIIFLRHETLNVKIKKHLQQSNLHWIQVLTGKREAVSPETSFIFELHPYSI